MNYVLSRRLELLREVARLQESLDVPGDVSYTCETAGHFYLYQVLNHTHTSLPSEHDLLLDGHFSTKEAQTSAFKLILLKKRMTQKNPCYLKKEDA